MADFKDVILRLQENRNSNVEAIQTQTSELSETIVSTSKTQNRSFGQSLALQFKKNNSELSALKSIFTDQVEFAEEQADNQQAMLDEAKRNAAQAGGEGAGMEGMGEDPMAMGEVPMEPDAEAMAQEVDAQYQKDTKKAEL